MHGSGGHAATWLHTEAPVRPSIRRPPARYAASQSARATGAPDGASWRPPASSACPGWAASAWQRMSTLVPPDLSDEFPASLRLYSRTLTDPVKPQTKGFGWVSGVISLTFHRDNAHRPKVRKVGGLSRR